MAAAAFYLILHLVQIKPSYFRHLFLLKQQVFNLNRLGVRIPPYHFVVTEQVIMEHLY